MTFDLKEQQKRQTRAVLDAVFPPPVAGVPAREAEVPADVGFDIDAEMGLLFAGDDREAELAAWSLRYGMPVPVTVEEVFPSRMQGIATDDPMYCLTQLVPEHADGRT